MENSLINFGKCIKTYFKLVLITFLFASSITIQAQQFKVLLYTSPDRWHDQTIPVAIAQFKKMAEKHDFTLVWVQANGSGNVTNVFTDDYLSKVNVIVFLNSRGYDLSVDQMNSFKKFIQKGGGFVGIHASSSNKDQDDWFKKLIGRSFTDHPEEQTAVLTVVDKNFPATMHLNDKWIWTDEWYSFGEELTPNLKLLLKVSEKTYDPNRTWGNKNRLTAMGDFHPISWHQEYDGGRSFYTALGHIPEAYNDPWFLAHIYGGIYWAATGLGIEK